MTHPFMAHMGLPDGPGESSARLTGIRRAGALGVGSDLAIHIEAGIIDRLGLHIRNDAITGTAMGSSGMPSEDHGTELMLMYSLIQNDDATSGISVFVEGSWPTDRGSGPSAHGALGLGARWQSGTRFLVDADLHVDPSDGELEIEYETSLQCRLTGRIFLLLEDRGNLGGHGSKMNYLLTGLKLGLGDTGGTFGVAFQAPVTAGKEYNRQAMVQLDWAF